MAIYLARHAPTEANLGGWLSGAGDWPLTASGRALGGLLAKTLLDAGVVRTFASPLGRAVATAEIMAHELATPVEILPGLSELSVGRLEGRSRAAVLSGRPFLRASPTFRPEGGESYEDAGPRVASALASIQAAAQRGSVLVVGHSVVNRLILARLLRAPLERFLTFTQPHELVLRISDPETLDWRDVHGQAGAGLPAPGEVTP